MFRLRSSAAVAAAGLLVAGGLAASGLAATPLAAQTTVTYTFTGAESTLGARLTRDGDPSMAGVQKVYPGMTGSGPFLFQTFSFVNPLSVAQTFAVTFVGATGSNRPFLSAYNASFIPTNLSTNYLGDGGFSCTSFPCDANGPGSFNIRAGANAMIVVVATLADDGTNGGDTITFQTTFPLVGPAINVTPTPEPSTYALTIAGLAGAAGIARRRRRTAA